MRDVRMTWMKFFLISMFITESLIFTKSRLSMTNSLVTTPNKQKSESNGLHKTEIQQKFMTQPKTHTGLLSFYKSKTKRKNYTQAHVHSQMLHKSQRHALKKIVKDS